MLERRAKKDVALEDAADAWDRAEQTEDKTFAEVCAKMGESRLLQAIAQLPERYRDALYYRFALQFSVAETAQAMEQSVSATKKQVQRGKQKLLELLGE